MTDDKLRAAVDRLNVLTDKHFRKDHEVAEAVRLFKNVGKECATAEDTQRFYDMLVRALNSNLFSLRQAHAIQRHVADARRCPRRYEPDCPCKQCASGRPPVEP